MSQQNVFMVQHFERRVKALVARQAIAYRTSEEALARAERDVDVFSGVVVYEVTIEVDTGDARGKPEVLARFGEVGSEISEA